jgi:aspartate/tyrosine/aromatic aminotransferase
MKHWVFGKVLPKYEKKFSMSVAITPGTSTALFISLSMNNKIPVLNSDLTWPMYEKAAQVVGQKYFSYSFLSNKYTFNDVSFKRTINKIFEKYGAINIIFNDPCHNPTGYTMDKND